MHSIFCCCSKFKKACGEESETATSTCHHYGAITLTGYKPGITNWVNQDAYFVDSKVVVQSSTTSARSNKHIFGIFDGHGTLGHRVSSFCRDKLMDIQQLSGGDFPKAFEYLQEALVNSDIDIDSSGTTGTIVMIHEGKVEVSIVF